jgi:translation initiation factor 2B subunit (eIF-2B alpha/beta/delta family)
MLEKYLPIFIYKLKYKAFFSETFLNTITEIGVDVRYATIAGLSYMMAETDVVILAASSLFANGSVMCSKGSAIVACVAKEDQGNFINYLQSYFWTIS